MDNPPGLLPEAEQVITNAQLGISATITLNVNVAEIKVRNTTTGEYDVTYDPQNVSVHRFIRYILLKTDTEKETYYKNTNPHSLKTTYYYDGLGQMLAVDDPDRGKTEFVYDDEGKLRFSQNAVQRAIGSKCFSYIRYDAQGRVKETGQYTGPTTGFYYFTNGYYEADVTTNLTAPKNLLNETIKNSTGDLFLASQKSDVNLYYYDVPATLPASAPAAYTTQFGEGNLVKMENTEQATWLRYNYRGETTGSVTQYKTLGTNDIGYKTFDFQYDIFGRLKKSTYQLNAATETFSQLYTYNANGDLRYMETAAQDELVKRHQNNTYYKTGAPKRTVLGNATQGIDYTYTIDGKLKSINHPQLDDKDPGGDGYGISGIPNDVFGLALDYYPKDYVRAGTSITYGTDNGTGEKYDGRIKSVRWNTRSPSVQAAAGKETMYKYDYDWEQNLAIATFGAYTPNAATNGTSGGSTATYGTFAAAANSGYTEQIKDATTEPNNWYDRNGNIKLLKRYKGDGTVMDNLAYQYATGTNRLRNVTETATFQEAGINDVQPQVTDNYTYNEIGDIKEDQERNIKVTYNAYGRLSEVRNRTNNNLLMAFYYDASGKRVRKVTYDATGTAEKTTLYLRDPGGTTFSIFEDHSPTNTATFVQSEILLDGGALGAYYPQVSATKYRYNIADHLGNVRATVERDLSSGAVVIGSYADYYAWGMTMPGRDYSSSPRFRLGYQGQEYESKVGMYGFSLRLYDQRLGRWFSTDPYGQHWSPYLAMGNNPVRFVDPDGGWDWDQMNSTVYYVDGFQVSASEFGMWKNGAISGDGMSFSGAAETSTPWGLIPLKYYDDGRGWGIYVDVTLPPKLNKDARFNFESHAFNSKRSGGYTTQAEARIGSKFKAGHLLTNPNPRPDRLSQAERPYGTNPIWGGLTPDGGLVNRFFYSVINSAKIAINAIVFKDRYVENLNGFGYVERGSSEYQSEVMSGFGMVLPVGEVVGALKVSIKGAEAAAKLSSGWMNGSRIIGQDAITALNASRMVPEAGIHQVLLHGKAEGFIVDGAFKSAKELARTMLQSGFQKGTTVRLISCHTGVFPDGAAYQLSRYLRSPVLAPTRRIQILEGGAYKIDDNGIFKLFNGQK